MNTKLSYIRNWPELARQANWSCAELAKLCGVSVRTLERHFYKLFDRAPKKWLIEDRQREAINLLRTGSSMKEISARLGYRQPSTFSREFAKRRGSFQTSKSRLINPPPESTVA